MIQAKQNEAKQEAKQGEEGKEEKSEDRPATGIQQLARERKLPRTAPSEANETKHKTKQEEERKNKEGKRENAWQARSWFRYALGVGVLGENASQRGLAE